jgi:GAF domain-containing protein
MSELFPRSSNQYLHQENTRLKQENDQLNEAINSYKQFVSSLDSLAHASDTFKDDSELLPFLRTTLINAMVLLNAPDGSLALLDDENNELVFVIVIGKLSDKLTNHRIPSDEGIAGWVVQQNKPALVRDVHQDKRFFRGIDDTFTFQTLSIAAAPLVGDRKVYGLIEVLNQPGTEPFSQEDLALLKLLCRVAGEALADIDRMPSNNT